LEHVRVAFPALDFSMEKVLVPGPLLEVTVTV
jgi:hypothetical protein